MAERLNAAVLKTVERESVPGVRILLPPPVKLQACVEIRTLFCFYTVYLSRIRVSGQNVLLI